MDLKIRSLKDPGGVSEWTVGRVDSRQDRRSLGRVRARWANLGFHVENSKDIRKVLEVRARKGQGQGREDEARGTVVSRILPTLIVSSFSARGVEALSRGQRPQVRKP